ncbi:MAG: glucosamine-6-phosphate isomerase, partial [Bacteroidetes bacterium]
SVLHKLKNGRFYTTTSAAAFLTDSVDKYYESGKWTQEKTERAVINLCKKLDKYGHHLVLGDLKHDRYCKQIPGLNENTVQTVIDSISNKMKKGLANEENQIYYHTGPHHDDVMLGILPHINRQLRSASNEFHFAVLTSGFTAVTNSFIIDALRDTKKFLDLDKIEMIKYKDFFNTGYKYKWDKDVYHYLNKVAAQDKVGQKRGLCHRIVRAIVEIYDVNDKDELRYTINDIIAILKRSYDG